MEENYISPILYQIFPHLKTTEPTTAVKYYRLRASPVILIDRKIKVSFFYILDKLIVNVGLKWIFQHGNIKEQYNATPFVGISFNNLQHEINTRHERFCCNKFFNCFLVDLKSSNFMHLSEKSDSLFRINFPIKDWSDVTIISYINQHLASKYSSNLLYFEEEDSNQALHFLSQLQNFVTQKYSLSRIVIIFCRETYFKKLLRLIRTFSFWFGFYCITIWIAVVDEITICRYNFGNHYCKIDTEFLFMFINNPSYKAYFRYLLPHCDTPNTIKTQLKQFRQEIVLFEDSTAFMHVSFGRMEEFYFLDTSLFKEVFPEVRLLPFFGKASYMGHCFYHLPNLSVSSYTEEQVKHTSILIISRNK